MLREIKKYWHGNPRDGILCNHGDNLKKRVGHSRTNCVRINRFDIDFQIGASQLIPKVTQNYSLTNDQVPYSII